MATSSIFANIKITDPQKIEAFADPLPPSNTPKKTVLSDPDKIREILAKRSENR